ncbi:histidine kinase [Haloechinothrix sp. LS1_15]|uniref:sensor histidine kinase n=1 Tax=Haloechinothrix sp. LS1_15 TaxID=2652248 RepID=UPI002943FD3F|nr:histidine kinase [Haloechinothrix sp. LS1_15]MDV6011491.1 sensor histidine kinase [Haloechinothrix sp. LS1_15]
MSAVPTGMRERGGSWQARLMPLAPSPLRWWRHATQVQRVDAYTAVTLHVMLWVLPAVALVRLIAELTAGQHAPAVATLTGAVVLLGCTGSWQLHLAMRHYPGGRQRPLAPLAVLALAATVCVAAANTAPGDEPTHWGMLATGYVLTIAVSPLLRSHAATTWAVVVGIASLVAFREPTLAAIHLAIAAIFIATVRTSLWLREVVRELDRARTAQGALDVAEERLRFSRDLHDVLGRNLSAIAVTSELAAELGARGDDRAPERMRRVHELAHDSLREVRELARGYRDVSFDSELSGARSLLESAGIDCDIELGTRNTPELTGQEQEMAAWVVREAVTNVLRHSSATRCAIRLAGRTLVVSNDGAGRDRHEEGNGLAGLRERLAPSGATLATDACEGSFTVTVTFPGKDSAG